MLQAQIYTCMCHEILALIDVGKMSLCLYFLLCSRFKILVSEAKFCLFPQSFILQW